MVRRDFLEVARESEDEGEEDEHENEEDESTPRALLPSQVEEFVQYLRGWGF